MTRDRTRSLGDLIQLPDLGFESPEAWREHDERIQAERDAEDRAREDARRADRVLRLLQLGCPRRLVQVLEDTRTDTAPMVALSRITEHQVVVLAGGVGIGKSMAALHWLLHAQGRPWFSTATSFARCSRYGEQAWERAHVAVLDDLGVEFLDTKGSFSTDLDELIAHYHGQCKGLVITTNLTADAFKSRYGARVASRIREAGAFLTVQGRDLRTRRTQP